MAEKDVKLNVSQLINIFYQLTFGQKVALGFITLAIFISLVGVIIAATETQYSPLYVKLTQQDAFNIIEELKKRKVDYKYQPDDGVIRVPDSDVDELRLYFASQGQPKSGRVGFDLFDKQDFGVTDFVQKVNFRRALEGELASTIMSMDIVDSATVHITPSKESPFVEETAPAKASVFLKLRSSRRPSEEQVESIMNIVASGVEELEPRYVVVVDQAGRTLSSNEDEDSLAGITSAQMRIKKDVEKDLRKKVITLLEPVVGIGRVRAHITAELDFDKIKEISETFDSEAEPIIRSERETTEVSQDGLTGGAPGAESNLPGGDQAEALQNQKKRERTDKTTNYEVSKVTREIITGTGTIKKMSVSVLLDNKLVEEEVEDGQWEAKEVSFTDEELEKINSQVVAAIGLQAARGDVISVENMAFTPTITREEYDAMESEKLWNDVFKVAKPMILLFVFVVILFLVVKPMFRTIIRPVLESFKPAIEEKKVEKPKRLPPKTVSELEAEIEAEIDSEFIPGVEVKRGEIIRQRVVEAVRNDPEQAAGLFRSLIADDES